MRTTISIDDAVGDLAEKIAEKDFRGNFSHLCETALKEYCEPRRTDETTAQIAAAIQDLGKERTLSALRNAARTRKRAA